MPTAQQLKAKALKLRNDRKACAKSFLSFYIHMAPFVMERPEQFQVKEFHRIICEQLQVWVEEPDSKIMLACPPQFGKSFITSQMLVAWIFGVRPWANVAQASYALAPCIKNAEKVKQIMEHPEYAQIFPNTKIGGDYKKTQTEFRVAPINGRPQGFYKVIGIGGGITSFAVDYSIADDLFADQDDSSSPKQQERVWAWWNSSWKTRAPNGHFCNMGTRWNVEDVHAKLMAEPDAAEWVRVTYPLECTNPNAPFEYRAMGELLWEERLNRKKVENLKFNKYWFACIYQQDPVILGGDVLKKEWIKPTYSLPKFTSLTMFWDIGGSDNETSDRTVGTLIGKTQEGEGVVIFVDFFRLTPDQRNKRMADTCEDIAQIFPSTRFILEAGFGLGKDSVDRCLKGILKKGVNARTERSKGSKFERATFQKDNLIACAGAGMISFYGGMNQNNWQKAFWDEVGMMHFVQTPQGPDWAGSDHDDFIDSLVTGWSYTNRPEFKIQFLDDVIREYQKTEGYNYLLDPNIWGKDSENIINIRL